MAANPPRADGRKYDQLRPVKITTGFVKSADGSCLIEVGNTRVICTASIDRSVPKWREESGAGWVTAEYAMLPASTGKRKPRPGLKPDSRSVEIQRLIGRSLRNVVNFIKLGANTIAVDCDVLDADGGTRTASITGAYVAMVHAVEKGIKGQIFSKGAITSCLAAVSVGIVDSKPMLDLCYSEDSLAEVDMNIVMTGGGKFVELQATGEQKPFDSKKLDAMLKLGRKGVRELMQFQKAVLKRKV